MTLKMVLQEKLQKIVRRYAAYMFKDMEKYMATPNNYTWRIDIGQEQETKINRISIVPNQQIRVKFGEEEDYEAAEVLKDNRDGTFQIKYADGQILVCRREWIRDAADDGPDVEPDAKGLNPIVCQAICEWFKIQQLNVTYEELKGVGECMECPGQRVVPRGLCAREHANSKRSHWRFSMAKLE